MKFKAFSIFDTGAESYNTPMFVGANGQATRSFADQCNDPESLLNRHHNDFELFLLGEFDSRTGLLTPLSRPQSFGKAADFINHEEKS